MKQRKIVLESGRSFVGEAFGAGKDALCELVFNTSMAGYQEILSDPSYCDQAVVMTYPLIGNYGITDEDYETKTPTMGGMIVREYNDMPSNFRYTKTLSEILEENGIPGIQGVDTRRLTRVIRDEGSQKVLITSADTPHAEAMEMLKSYQMPTDQVRRVSCKKKWYARTANHRFNVVAVDCGIKLNIVRKLNEFGCNVTVVPYDTPAETILSFAPDGLFLSNGPGNPEDVVPVINLVRQLHGKLPILGYRMGPLTYITDMKTIDDGELQYIKGTEVLVVNALRQQPHHSHQTVDDAVGFARRVGAKRTLLIHSSHHIGLHDEVNASLPSDIQLAYDGQVVEVW